MSRPRFLADQNFNANIVHGVQRLEPALEVTLAREAGLDRIVDDAILDHAAKHNWIVLSHDVKTMTATARARIVAGLPMIGLILVHQHDAIGRTIDDLVLLWACSEAEEWDKQIRFLPL